MLPLSALYTTRGGEAPVVVEGCARVPDDVPDDEATFQMLCAGEALGVFQLESSGMRDLLRRIRPETFDDLTAIVIKRLG